MFKKTCTVTEIQSYGKYWNNNNYSNYNFFKIQTRFSSNFRDNFTIMFHILHQ